jgi:uncharacterized protein
MLKKEITFQNVDVVLNGTLLKPDTAEPCPVVIVAHTSNAGTRDFDVYQHLARVLTACGIAVFIFDRRGSGHSTGEFEIATFFDLASDILMAVDCLKLRSDIDPKYIGLWGMSQGGWIAPLAAIKSTDIAFVIAISASGVSPAEQMSYSAEFELQENGFSEEVIEQMLKLHRLVNEYYRGNTPRFEAQEKLNLYCNERWFSHTYLDDLLPEIPSVTKWYQEMDFDPIPMIQKVSVPVLLLYGETDPWVPIKQSIALWKEFGSKRVTIHEIKDANHFMKSIAQSGIRGDKGHPVDKYTEILIQWVKQELE